MKLSIIADNGRTFRNANLESVLDKPFTANKNKNLKHIDNLLQVLRKIKIASNKKKTQLAQLKKELAVLKQIVRMPNSKQVEALEELESVLKGNDELKKRRLEEVDGEPDEDIDPKEELRRRRLDPDDAKLGAEIESEKHSQYQGKYNVLEYHVGSIEKGDGFMKKIIGNYKQSENGDKFLQDLGAG